MSFSVIIPSKSAANLVPCVKAIRDAGETCRIIVINDGLEFTPDTAGPFFETAGYIECHPGVRPFCFSRNINIGIEAAGRDDVILLNDDALLKTPRGFSELLLQFALNWKCGLISAACDTTGNPNQHPRSTARNPPMRFEPRTVCFICVFIPRVTIDRVGLLDERFVDYGMEDDDYCLRVRNAGLKLGIFDGCFVDHGSLKSSFRGGPAFGGDFTANMRRFIQKWGVDNWGRDRARSEFAGQFPPEV